MTQRSAAEELARSLPTTPFVAGQWQPRRPSPSFDVIDPVTECRITTVTEADAATVDRAVVSAHDALDGE